MPGSGGKHGPFSDTGYGKGDGGEIFRLLRRTHIFASAVREILQLGLLREITPLPLTLSQFHLLKLMTYNGEHHVCELAKILGVSAPAATKNVDKLERLELVVREPSRGDRRATVVSSSQKGSRLVGKYEKYKAERISPVLGSLQPEEVERLSELLERFAISLLKTGGADRGFCLRCDAYIEDDCPVGRACGGCPYRNARATRATEGF
jgi:MarR family transcriptional regulator, organic hydroperoxide resistance regulator